ncbi:hypothetical protein [Pseudomonas chlororaphis]|uniref:hypothetical protein n=1 Tax=Pseudomonas chlororaphis TaxID=587753 RepID=UPI000F718099|nr:hypothetical protein C4K27_2153 [Pseudomonas chlororaphis subsp. chlororaphis]
MRRTINQAATRRRQTWLGLPASGIEEVAMAKTGKERSAKAALKRIEFDEKELRHRLRLGTRQMLDELMAWNNIEEISEAVQNLIINAHALGPTLSFQAIESPRHKVQISENVARMFRDESLAELKRDLGDEIIHPGLISTQISAD